jgi:DNA-binding MltR family transcriptional regulator
MTNYGMKAEAGFFNVKGQDAELTYHPSADTIKRLVAQSEFGTALVVGALVENSLEQLLIAVSRHLSNTTADMVFGGTGPLSTFSAKIHIAYIFEFIDESSYNELRTIKDIRNRFAHPTNNVSFENEQIVSYCSKLVGWVKGCDNKALFEERALACIGKMNARIDAEIHKDAFEN